MSSKKQPVIEFLDAVISSLTKQQQRLLSLKFGQEMSNSQIAKVAPALGLDEVQSETKVSELIGGMLEIIQIYERELDSAKRVQQKLLPDSLPKIDDVEVAVRYQPFLGVSGDYYDFIAMDERRLGVALGDVSGKGISAALLMASARASLRAHARAHDSTAETLGQLNQILLKDSMPEHFLTLIYGILDTKSRTFSYSNAGHNPPLLYNRHSKSYQMLETGGTMVGILDEAEYEEESLNLSEGDVLVIYTDGIVEACNDAEEPFEVQRLCDIVQENAHQPAEKLIDQIYELVLDFCGELQDDATVLVLKVQRGRL